MIRVVPGTPIIPTPKAARFLIFPDHFTATAKPDTPTHQNVKRISPLLLILHQWDSRVTRLGLLLSDR
jgi:hypothetical protein